VPVTACDGKEPGLALTPVALGLGSEMAHQVGHLLIGTRFRSGSVTRQDPLQCEWTLGNMGQRDCRRSR